MKLLASLALAALLVTAEPVCRIDTTELQWQGTPAELAGVEAVYQAAYAAASGQAFTRGAPIPSPWRSAVRCTIAREG
jgi:Tfp pilus assembly protein PilV